MAAFTIALIVIPPLSIVLVGRLIGRVSSRWERVWHVAWTFVLSAALALPIIFKTGTNSLLVLSVAAGVSGFVTYRYVSGRFVNDLLTWLAPAPLLFAGLFLLTPPISRVVFPPAVSSLGTPINSTAPIVWVILDELPVTSLLNQAGEINAERFPNFAALAKDSIWFANVVTPADSTFKSVPSILTGNSPQGDALPVSFDHPNNLFTFLAGRYKMNVVEPLTQLCDPDVCSRAAPQPESFPTRAGRLLKTGALLLPRILMPPLYDSDSPTARDVFGEFVNAPQAKVTPEEFGRFRDEAVVAQATSDRTVQWRRFVESITPGTALNFLHIFLPHPPYEYMPSGARYKGLGLPGRKSELWVDSWRAQQGYQRHLLQLKHVDNLIGELVEHLKQIGVFDDALIVLTSDHGVSFRNDDETRVATESNVGDVALVPLLIKAPHQTKGKVARGNVRSIDILPTVAALLGTKLPWETDGRDVLENPLAIERFSIINSRGQTVTLESLDKLRLGLAQRLQNLFPPNTDRFDLFRVGQTYSELVGTPVAELTISKTTLNQSSVEFVASMRSDGSSVGNIYVEGKLEGPRIEVVAVVVNGVIVTVVPTQNGNGFSAMLPQAGDGQGAQSFGLFSVKLEPGGKTLHRIRVQR